MSLKFFREFVKLESSAGFLLFVTALLALIVSNTPWSSVYNAFFHLGIKISVGKWHIEKPLLLWVNEGLMSIFFLLVGLEIKREMYEGELNTFQKAMLPGIAAVGGMIFPAAIYLSLNHAHPEFSKGWAIPTATDTAFSLAILSLLKSRIPAVLKTFLMALAIFDDIGAILIIAAFYASNISMGMLLSALLFIFILCLLNYFNVRRLGPYCLVGLLLWLCVLQSGVHATLAGIILAAAIPVKNPEKIKNTQKPRKSPLHLLEQKLHPWVAFGILPIFALANAGVSFSGMDIHAWVSPVPLGIALGLFLGKPMGICGFIALAVRSGIAKLPDMLSWRLLFGMSLTAGVGFTMSLFIGTLAFDAVAPYATWTRMGVLLGSLVSGFFGYCVLRKS